MSSIGLSIPTGAYPDGQTANWVISDQVEYFAFNKDGIPPAISEYIAYDQLDPPSPFLAVTQDGNGRVVYDGGFPKFYNSLRNPSATTFADLPPAHKFAYNALNWCASPTIVAAKGKKVLVLGDTLTATPSYNVKGVEGTGFNLTLTQICNIAGFTPTFKTRDDYAGGLINPTLTELNEFACVFFIGGASSTNGFLTDTGEQELVNYRRLGGGLIVVTDHGPVITSLENAWPLLTNGFFGTCNKLIRNFGVWFSGDYARSPVNVGHIRNTYGDHPLYANMADTDAIYAGASESEVIVADFTKFTKVAPPPPVVMDTNGIHVVNVTALLTGGIVESVRLVYIIAEGQLIRWMLGAGEINSVELGLDSSFTPLLEMPGVTDLGTVIGGLWHNTSKVGEFFYSSETGPKVTWFGGSATRMRFKHGDTLRAAMTIPFNLDSTVVIDRINLDPEGRLVSGLPTEVKYLAPWSTKGEQERLFDIVKSIKARVPSNALRYDVGAAGMLRTIREYSENLYDSSAGQAFIFPTTVDTLDALSRLQPPTPLEIFDSWGRFQGPTFYPPGTSAPPGSESAAWTWDAQLNSAVQPLNTVAYVGFVSKEWADNYEHDVVLTSTNTGDDDGIGVVLATSVNLDGTINTLSALVHPGGLRVFNPIIPETLSILYNYGAPGFKNITGVSHVPNTPSTTWSGRKMRVFVQRQGNRFIVRASDWDSLELNEASRIEFSLSDDPDLAKFEGPRPYGYSTVSQPQSFFQNITFSGGILWDTIIDAQADKVYRFVNGAWSEQVGIKAKDIFGVRRTLTSYEDGSTYYIAANGTITAT